MDGYKVFSFAIKNMHTHERGDATKASETVEPLKLLELIYPKAQRLLACCTFFCVFIRFGSYNILYSYEYRT